MSVKDELIKTVSYIKRDIQDVEQELNELQEALGYLHKLPIHLRQVYKTRITRYNAEVEKLQTKLTRYKRELKDFIKDSSLDKATAETIMPATDMQLEADYAKDMAELSNPRASEVKYNKGQHLEIVEYCKALQLKGVDPIQ